MSQCRSFSSLEDKIQWLLKHHIFLVGEIRKQEIVTAMKRDGLVSKLTYWPDVDVSEAVHQAKIRWFASHNRRVEKAEDKQP